MQSPRPGPRAPHDAARLPPAARRPCASAAARLPVAQHVRSGRSGRARRRTRTGLVPVLEHARRGTAAAAPGTWTTTRVGCTAKTRARRRAARVVRSVSRSASISFICASALSALGELRGRLGRVSSAGTRSAFAASCLFVLLRESRAATYAFPAAAAEA